MSYDWIGYLDVARALAAGDDESRWRSSISRAYYSVFHLALDWIVTKEPQLRYSVPRDGRVHEFLFDHFNNSKTRQAVAVAGKLKSLRKARTAADYDGVPPVAKVQADTSLDQATKLIAALQTL